MIDTALYFKHCFKLQKYIFVSKHQILCADYSPNAHTAVYIHATVHTLQLLLHNAMYSMFITLTISVLVAVGLAIHWLVWQCFTMVGLAGLAQVAQGEILILLCLLLIHTFHFESWTTWQNPSLLHAEICFLIYNVHILFLTKSVGVFQDVNS